ncbi:MAG: beta-lactamase family protein [Leptospiraceae bacterium]|nr:beta-lactamase family protein [Leptospiraceae bacterium]
MLPTDFRLNSRSELRSEARATELAGGSAPAVDPWNRVLDNYGGLSSAAGLGSWLWQRQKQYKDLQPRRIRALVRAESDLRDYIEGGTVSSSFPRHALEVQYHGSPVLTLTRGLKREEMHSVASVTKAVTAVAILRLVQEQKIGLNDDIALYFKEAPHLARPLGGVPIRIRDLLQHSSGISYSPADGAIVRGLSGLAYPIGRQFRPAREDHHYSNFNYYILAALIERVSHKSYQRYIHEDIFAPLQMQHSRIPANIRGAAGMHSSVADLAWFMNAVFGKRLDHPFLERRYIAEMIKKPDHIPFHPEMTYYALGVRVQLHNGKVSSVFHSGIWNGMFGEMRYFPETDAALAHIGNPPCFRCAGVQSYRWQSVALTNEYLRKIKQVFSQPGSDPAGELVIKKQ